MPVYLRPFELDDFKLINKWRNDQELHKLTGNMHAFISGDTERNWVAEKMKFNAREIYVAICLNETNEMVGYCCLTEINNIYRTCTMRSIVIGSDAGKGKNAAFTALSELFEYAFNSLNMHRICASYFQQHEKSARLFAKLGFKVEAVLRKSWFKSGSFHNEVVVGLLREDFEAMKANAIH